MIVALAGLFTLIAYSTYEENNYKMKRVVAPAAETGGLFTSNFLTVGGGVKSVYYQENDKPPFTFPVEIRNYNQNDPNTKYQGTISYSISARLSHADGRAYSDSELSETSSWNKDNMSITISNGTDTIALSGSKISDTLGMTTKYTLTDSHDKDEWTVVFTNIPLDSDYFVTIAASPINQDLEDISQTLGVSSVPIIYTEGWNCTLADDTSTDIDNYDAFNYTITGTGKKTLKFSYDSTVLEINPSFCSYVAEASNGSYSGKSQGDRTNWKTVTIDADPDTTYVNRYDFQMYKVGSFSPGSYEDIKIETKEYVEFDQFDAE